jgi:hypothetical protein
MIRYDDKTKVTCVDNGQTVDAEVLEFKPQLLNTKVICTVELLFQRVQKELTIALAVAVDNKSIVCYTMGYEKANPIFHY